MALGVTAYSEAPFSADTSDVFAYPSGIELTVQENTGIVIGDANVPVTGTPLVSAVGTASGSSLVNVDVTGQDLTATEGTLAQSSNQEIDVTGFDLIANGSNPTHDTLTAFGEAPFATLSPATFNIPVKAVTTSGGIANSFLLSTSLGTISVAANADATLSGFDLTMQENDVSIEGNAVVSITGEPLAITQGTAQAFTDVIIEDVTGIAMSANLNSVNVAANADATLSGFDLTMQENALGVVGDANVSITGFSTPLVLGTAQGFTDVTTEDVTGIEMTMAQGSVAITGNVDLTLSGFDLTIQENAPTVTGNANVPVTALPMTAALGTAVLDANSLIDLTGFDLTMQEGTATAPDSLAILTGIEMTMAEGSIQNIIWNPVDTGNAPIDPPGWKEVA